MKKIITFFDDEHRGVYYIKEDLNDSNVGVDPDYDSDNPEEDEEYALADDEKNNKFDKLTEIEKVFNDLIEDFSKTTTKISENISDLMIIFNTESKKLNRMFDKEDIDMDLVQSKSELLLKFQDFLNNLSEKQKEIQDELNNLMDEVQDFLKQF